MYLYLFESTEFSVFFFFASRKSLGDRLQNSSGTDQPVTSNRLGSTSMAFTIEKKSKYNKQRESDLKKHREERKSVIRPIKSLHLKKYVPKS